MAQKMKDNDVPFRDNELIDRIRRYALAAVSEQRYAHSVRTAETAVTLCRLYGADESKGYLAGIAHDMCKGMSGSLLVTVAARDGNPISALEAEKPSLLHGRAAAVKLREDFALEDSEILEAVAYHTFGKKDMGTLAKIIYTADKIEPGRDGMTEDRLSRLMRLDLDSLAGTVLEENIGYLRQKGRPVAPESLEFLRSLKNRSVNA